jgi:hypothetical protein
VLACRREVRRGQHQPALVPQVHDDVGQRQLLDAPPFLLDDHHVVDPQRVGEDQLQTGEEVAQRGLRGETRDDAGHPGGGQHRRAVRPQAAERHQDRRDGDDRHHDGRQPAQGGQLGADLARAPVVLHVDPDVLQHRVLGQEQRPHQQPRDGRDRGHREHVRGHTLGRAAQSGGRQRREQADGEQGREPRPVAVLVHPQQERAAAEPGDPGDELSAQPPDEQRPGRRGAEHAEGVRPGGREHGGSLRRWSTVPNQPRRGPRGLHAVVTRNTSYDDAAQPPGSAHDGGEHGRSRPAEAAMTPAGTARR